jgi:hypothetical protein
MATIQIFDPPLCCSTGVCGPSVDPDLARFAADVDWLKANGVQVERFNLAQQPGAFAASEVVKASLQSRGNDCLPLLLMDGRVIAEGTYPSRETLAALAGIVVRKIATVEKASSGCCGPSAASPTAKKCC